MQTNSINRQWYKRKGRSASSHGASGTRQRSLRFFRRKSLALIFDFKVLQVNFQLSLCSLYMPKLPASAPYPELLRKGGGLAGTQAKAKKTQIVRGLEMKREVGRNRVAQVPLNPSYWAAVDTAFRNYFKFCLANSSCVSIPTVNPSLYPYSITKVCFYALFNPWKFCCKELYIKDSGGSGIK